MDRPRNAGFTLLELSIVLVIIGLIVGGVLVGRNLIEAASIRAQISQIEKYNTAVNTFRAKYGYLPGDMPNPYATGAGFTPRGSGPGQGDGNDIIEGIQLPGYNVGTGVEAGETAVFWEDLTTANGMNLNLIPGSFNTASMSVVPGTLAGSVINSYLPVAAIGQGNFVYAYSGGVMNPATHQWTSNHINYFGVSGVTVIGTVSNESTTSLSVSQAYNIDQKIDDGLPQSGRVMAQYINYNVEPNTVAWASGGPTVLALGGMAQTIEGAFPGTSAPASSTTCYDNGGNTNALMQYSIGQNNGAGMNCAPSFQFQ